MNYYIYPTSRHAEPCRYSVWRRLVGPQRDTHFAIADFPIDAEGDNFRTASEYCAHLNSHLQPKPAAAPALEGEALRHQERRDKFILALFPDMRQLHSRYHYGAATTLGTDTGGHYQCSLDVVERETIALADRLLKA